MAVWNEKFTHYLYTWLVVGIKHNSFGSKSKATTQLSTLFHILIITRTSNAYAFIYLPCTGSIEHTVRQVDPPDLASQWPVVSMLGCTHCRIEKSRMRRHISGLISTFSPQNPHFQSQSSHLKPSPSPCWDCNTHNVLGLKRVLILLPGYPTLTTRRVPGYSLQWISSLTNTAGLPTSTFFVYFVREIMKKYGSTYVLNKILRP